MKKILFAMLAVLSIGLIGCKESDETEKWEYTVVLVPPVQMYDTTTSQDYKIMVDAQVNLYDRKALTDTLNMYGSKGWELVNGGMTVETKYPGIHASEPSKVTDAFANIRSGNIYLFFKRRVREAKDKK